MSSDTGSKDGAMKEAHETNTIVDKEDHQSPTNKNNKNSNDLVDNDDNSNEEEQVVSEQNTSTSNGDKNNDDDVSSRNDTKAIDVSNNASTGSVEDTKNDEHSNENNNNQSDVAENDTPSANDNVNSTVLGYGDDYTNMLNTLGYDSSNSSKSNNANSENIDNDNNDNSTGTSNNNANPHNLDNDNKNNTNNLSSGGNSGNDNLDSLIQHYQGLIRQHQNQQFANDAYNGLHTNNEPPHPPPLQKNDQNSNSNHNNMKIQDSSVSSQNGSPLVEIETPKNPMTITTSTNTAGSPSIITSNAITNQGMTPMNGSALNSISASGTPTSNSINNNGTPLFDHTPTNSLKKPTKAVTKSKATVAAKPSAKIVKRKKNTPTNTKTVNNKKNKKVAETHTGNNTTVINQDKKICDHCRRRQTQCVQVPNLQNCIQCESKGIKCTYSELASNKTHFELEQLKRSRVDENVNVHDLLKRAKVDHLGNYTSNGSSAPIGNGMPLNTANNINSLQSYSEMLQTLAPQQFDYSTSSTPFPGMNSNLGGTADNAFAFLSKTSNVPSPNNVDMFQQQQQRNSSQLQQQQQYVRQAIYQMAQQPIQSPNSQQSPITFPPQLLQQQQQQQLSMQQIPDQQHLHAMYAGSAISAQQLNQKGSSTSESVAPSYPRSSFYVGPTSLFDYNLINHVKLDKIDQIQISPSLTLRKVAPAVQFILRDDFNEQLYLKQEQEIDLVEKMVYPHGKVLVDIFFKVIHPYYPILHERVFMEKYSRSYRELTAPLLASIYSLALQWWHYHPQLAGFPKPNVEIQLNELALRTFFDVVERPKLSIVQAGLLILMCRSESSNNWVIVSEVVALAEELGLGIDCQDWRLPRWERGLRRRLAWAVWSMDKWISSSEGRYSHLILGRNWLVKMLSDEDFPEDPSTTHAAGHTSGNSTPGQPLGKNVGNGTSLHDGNFGDGSDSTFNKNVGLDIQPSPNDIRNGRLLFQQFVSLSIILGEILDTFYTLGAMSITTKVDYVLKLAKPLQLKLREWYHSLPTQLSMNYVQPHKLNSNASLTLAYFAAEITLHRKIISTLDAATPIELSHVCRQAAKTRLSAAIEFICELKLEHTSSFWYSCSSTNMSLIGSFAALLYCTSSSKEEHDLYRNYLKKYIITLRISAKHFNKAAAALEFSQLLDDILL